MEKNPLSVSKNHNEENNEIQFLCLNQRMPEGVGRFLCKYCIEDQYQQNLIIISMERLNMKNKIVSEWPPLNTKINQEEINNSLTSTLSVDQIEQYYSNLKDNICKMLDEQKEQDIKLCQEMSNSNLILQKYNEISGFNEINRILDQNEAKQSTIEQELEEFIQLKYKDIQKNQECMDQAINSTLIVKEEDSFLIKMKEKILKKLKDVQILKRYADKYEIWQMNMVHSYYNESSSILVSKNDGKILLTPTSKELSGQLYSDQYLQHDKIYQFIISFNKKPTRSICIGFEEELLKNQELAAQGKNSFIIGQENNLFCRKLVRGDENLQKKCLNSFVKDLIIEVKLSENKFYISDYPLKTSVNCMDTAQYKFKPNENYYFTILSYFQDTQIEIKPVKIINKFTLV